MFTQRLFLCRNFALAMTSAFFVTTGFAGEPIEFSKGKSPDKEKDPAETHESNRATSLSSKLFRVYRPSETISGSDIFKSKNVIPAPRPSAPPTSSRRSEELLDRQKNWIFLSPDEKKSDGINEAFGINDRNPLEIRKGVLARFLENKTPDKETKLDDKNSDQLGILKEQTDDLNKTKGPRNPEFPTTSSLQPQFLERNFAGSDSEKARFGDLWREQYGPGANRFREEKQAQMKEFEGLFSSQNNPAPVGNGFGTVNVENTFAASLATAPNRGAERFNSSAASSSSDPYKSVARPVLGASIIAAPDINSRVFGTTPAAPASSLEPVKSISQPAVLPFPKRHF